MPRAPLSKSACDGGFSLLETLIAAVVVATGVAALAQLATASLASTARARQTTFAAVVAQQKVEALYADAAAGGLPPSPSGTLDRNIDGYCEFVDGTGRTLGPVRLAVPPGSAFVRRWSIDPVPDSPSRTSIVQVLVLDLRRGVAGASVPGLRVPGTARLLAAVPGQAF